MTFSWLRPGAKKDSWLADFRILTEQQYKPVVLFRERDFISTPISPGKTGLKAKDSENDSLGRYCENCTECGIFLMLIYALWKQNAYWEHPTESWIRGDAIMI